MLHDLINLHDFAALLSLVKRRGVAATFHKLTGAKSERIRATWQQTEEPIRHWWDIPLIQRHINRLITGDESREFCEYVASTYLTQPKNLAALSLGCGAGNKELAWFRTGKITTLDAYDISSERIEISSKKALKADVQRNVKFHTGDAFTLQIPPGRYDLVIFEDSLHHLSPVKVILKHVDEWLTEDGLLVLKEYVGPARFQWTDQQLRLVKSLLSLIPPGFRKRWPDGQLKTKEYRPGRLSISLYDPSEAAESSVIPALLRETFDIAEERPFGGTLLHLLFKDVAHNFLREDRDTLSILRFCCEVEETLLRIGELHSDFAAFVCRKKKK
jgi:SAM-dependent methyltransferase